MPEIYQFKVHKATAEYNGESLIIKLWYPKNPQIIKERLGANPEWGVKVLETLISKGFANLANKNNPVKPPSAGSLIVLNDEVFVCHRRDRYAPTHKLYHSASAGFPQNKRALFTKKGLLDLALTETAEETLLTRDKKPRLVVTPELEKYIIESSKRLGFDLQTYKVKEELATGKDTLEVYNYAGELIFSAKGFLNIMFDADTSISFLQLRYLDISSKEVLPVDAEGKLEGTFEHYNRESFLIHTKEIEGLKFASPLKNPRVFQTKLGGRFPKIYTPKLSPENYLGPGATLVTQPYLFAPEDLLTACLDGLGVKGYKGRKLYLELWKEKTLLKDADGKIENINESCLIPKEFLRK